MQTVQSALWIVVVLVVLAVVFDFMNGFHDAANSIATVVSTGVLKPGQAVIFAAFFNVVAIFVSPLLGFLLGSLMMVVVAWVFRGFRPLKVDKWFRRLQLVSAGAYSLGHGGNDSQKTIGIIWMLLIATGYSASTDAGVAGLWCHGCYFRKADHTTPSAKACNPCPSGEPA